MTGAALAVAWVLSTCALGDADPSPARHPVITEVLFNVPKGDEGDANRDGARHAAGDEFVELFNPHPATINLRGYTITSRLSTGTDSTRGVRFVFPDCEIGPGDVVVVFNGVGSRFDEPAGSAEACPKGTHEAFDNAWLFVTGNTSPNNAFSNAGDFVLLSAPDATPVDCISWGAPDPAPPSDTARITEAPKNPKGSVQRRTAEADLENHRDIDGTACSPGRLPPVN